jgi:hypothetical protein
MENPVRTNRLAIVSFLSGLLSLFALSPILFLLLFPPSPGNLPEPSSPINTLLTFSRSIGNLSTLVSLVTGILALREIKKKGGTEKGGRFAWVGILIGGGWILFRLLVAIYFILGMLFSLR